jgi:hypothetical protein
MHLEVMGCEGVDWIDLVQYGDPVTDCCEDGDEPSGCIKGEEFSDQLRYYQLLKDTAAC